MASPSSNSASLDYAEAMQLAVRLADPVLRTARGQGLMAQMPVEHVPGATRDRRDVSALEALGRLTAGLAPLLELQVKEGVDLSFVAAFQDLLAQSVDPFGGRKLNFTEKQQPLVDAAFLAQAVLRAPRALWIDLPAKVQSNLAQALCETRQIVPHFNNWLLFSAMIETALCRIGADWDRMRVDYALRQHEQWYGGDGQYSDGPHLRCDYYNSYVIHPMLDDILDALRGQSKVWDQMRKAHHTRMARHVEILERLIGTDGSFPPIGRSLTYRCGAFQSLAQLALKDRLPESLPHGQARAGLMAVIRRTLASETHYDAAGWLRIGLSGPQADLGESYISTGSLYLCSTAFLPLGLSRNHPFWSEEALAWTQRRIWDLSESSKPDKAFDG